MIPKGQILTHRGLWSTKDDQNAPEALAGALIDGWGIETDVRDFGERLVISHDPPLGHEPRLDHQALRWLELAYPGTVALNVKADGLADALAMQLAAASKSLDMFFFDMSAPQMITFVERGLPVAVRLSEIESPDSGAQKLALEPRIVWLDCFWTDWFVSDRGVDETIETSRTFLVSPEIHGRDPRIAWDWLALKHQLGHDVGICTDRPRDFWEHVS